MNRSYRVVNSSSGQSVVVSELSKGSKKSAGISAAMGVLASGLMAISTGSSFAAENCTLPDGLAGMVDATGVCEFNSMAQSPGTGSIGTMAALEDTFLQVNTGTYAADIAAQAGNSATGIGANANASGQSAVAIGGNTVAGYNSTAIGTLSKATGANSTALGLGSTAQTYNSVALGSGSVADRGTAVSVGSSVVNSAFTRQIINMSAGTAGTDAVNVNQLSPLVTALGGGAAINATTGKVTGPSYVLTNGGTQTTVGGALSGLDTALSTANSNITTGASNITTNTSNITTNASNITTLISSLSSGTVGLVQQVAAGADITVAAANGGTAVNFTGTGGVLRALKGVANGEINATSAEAVNGSQLFASNSSIASALAGGSVVNADGTLTLPSYVLANGGTVSSVGAAFHALDTAVTTNKTAISNLDKAFQDAGLSDGSGNLLSAVIYNADKSVVNFGGINGTLLSNVAGGLIGAGSMQAINGGQLFGIQSDWNKRYDDLVSSGDANWQDLSNKYNDLNQQVGDLTGQVGTIDDRLGSVESGLVDGSIGGGSTVNLIGNVEIGTGAAASDEHSTAIGSGANASGSNSTAIGDNAQASGSNSTATGTNASASGENSTASGANSSATGNNSVALGAGSIADRDNSVSVGSPGNERQITNVADGTAPTDAVNKRQLDTVQDSVNSTARAAYSGIAAVTALTMIPDLDPGKNFALGIGAAQYKGYAATALGVSGRVNDRIKVKAGIGLASAGNTVGVGGSFQW